MRRPDLSRPRRRTMLGALAGGSVLGLGLGVGGWYVLNEDGPADSDNSAVTETARLVPDDRPANNRFGASVGLAEGNAVVTAPKADDPNGRWAGAAYLFDRGLGGWTQRAEIAPDDGDAGDEFGADVALTGKTAIVGAPLDVGPRGRASGSAYVFGRSADGWNQQAKLAAAAGDQNDQFGRSVALDGDTALLGAPVDEDPNGGAAGSAYVFSHESGEWRQQAKLAAEDGDGGDVFGRSVAVAGTTALVGAPSDEAGGATNAGSASVFERSDGEWTQQAKLAPDDADGNDHFGRSVALAEGGDTALVGAYWDEDPNGSRAGSASLFERANGAWTRRAKLAAGEGEPRAEFGWAVDLAGGTALVGAPRARDADDQEAGAAYLFARVDGQWREGARLEASGGGSFDRFGRSVALGSERALVGAAPRTSSDGGDTGDAGDTGIVYVFDL